MVGLLAGEVGVLHKGVPLWTFPEETRLASLTESAQTCLDVRKKIELKKNLDSIKLRRIWSNSSSRASCSLRVLK